MTTLEDIRRLVDTGLMCLRSALSEDDGALAAMFTERGSDLFTQADRLLQGEPLEARHAELGTGILVGVNQSGWTLFHSDSSDHAFPVDVAGLREVAR